MPLDGGAHEDASDFQGATPSRDDAGPWDFHFSVFQQLCETLLLAKQEKCYSYVLHNQQHSPGKGSEGKDTGSDFLSLPCLRPRRAEGRAPASPEPNGSRVDLALPLTILVCLRQVTLFF